MISLQSKDCQEFSPTTQFKSISTSVVSFLYSPTLTSIHDYWKTIALTRWTFFGKVMSLLFNMPSRLVITFLPRSKHLLISQLQSSSTGEGNGTPLQYSCLENPMDGGAWWAAVHVVAKSRTQLSDFTFMHWRRKWQPTPVFLPGESQGWGSLVGCCLWGRTESDTTEAT